MNKFLHLLFLLLLYQAFASACSCDDTSLSLKDSYKYHDFIIHGRVLKKESVSFFNTISKKDLKQLKNSLKWKNKINEIEKFEDTKVEIEVIKTYKGKSKKNRVIIYTSKYNQSCGYQLFSEGFDYIIYAEKDNNLRVLFSLPKRKKDRNMYWTSQCSRTRYFNTKEDENLDKLL